MFEFSEAPSEEASLSGPVTRLGEGQRARKPRRDSGASRQSSRPRWSRLAPFPDKALFEYSAAWDDERGKLYVFGGQSEYDIPPNEMLWEFDRASNTWRTLNPAGQRPSARAGHAAVWDSGRRCMWVFGGGWSEFLNELWAYSPDANEWQLVEGVNPGPSPEASREVSMCWDRPRDRAVVCCTDGDVWVYAPGTRVWERVNTFGRPGGFSGSGIAWDPDSAGLYVFGGFEKPGEMVARGELWRFTTSGGWEQMQPTLPGPSGRVHPGLACGSTGQLYLLGGATGNFLVRFADFWQYNRAENSWHVVQSVGRGPQPRFRPHLLLDASARMLLVFGGSDHHARNDLWTCDFPREA